MTEVAGETRPQGMAAAADGRADRFADSTLGRLGATGRGLPVPVRRALPGCGRKCLAELALQVGGWGGGCPGQCGKGWVSVVAHVPW